MSKCTETLVTHLPMETATQLKALADAEGTTPSEKIRNLIDADILKNRTWFQRMQEVFGGEQNAENSE